MRVKVLSIGQYSCEKWPRQKVSVVNVLYGLRFSASENTTSLTSLSFGINPLAPLS